MKPICRLFVFIGLFFSLTSHAQNVLPDFTVRELTKGKIQISWNNPYKNCIQLAIQRSSDSSKNFRTIFSSQSPELATNGYVDSKLLPVAVTYYRIFFVLQGGEYYFTKAIPITTKAPEVVVVKITPPPIPAFKEPKSVEIKKDYKNGQTIYFKKNILFRFTKEEYQHWKDSINTKTKDALHRMNEHTVEWRPAKPIKKELYQIYKKEEMIAELDKKKYVRFKDSIKTKTKDTLFVITDWQVQIHTYVEPAKQYVFIYRSDSLQAQLDLMEYRKFKDSVSTKTKDTLFAIDQFHVDIHSFVPKYVWKPSQYIFTNTKGYVTILLPLAKQHKYNVIFYEENGTELFKIKSIKEPELILDKTDFIHAGWFYFELYENDKLKEKSKFFLPRD